MTPRPGAFFADVACVVLFAAAGRASHAEGVTVPGIASVASPFLLALALGWGVARVWRGAWPVESSTGAAVVWLVTVVVGLVLRVAFGGGFAPSFGLVTLFVLGALLIGWRMAARVVGARVRRRPGARVRRNAELS